MLPESGWFWIISIIVYMVVLLGVSHMISKWEIRRSNRKGHLLSTELSWPVLVMTYTASMMSTYVFIGGPGIYYRNGIGHWFEELSYFIMFVVIFQLIMNRIWIICQGKNYESPSDFFDLRFKSPVLRMVLGIVFLAASFPYIASVLGSIARAVVYLSNGGISYGTVVVLVGIIMVFFTVIGGLNAVAWSDTLQGLLYVGVIMLTPISVLIIGYDGSLTDAIAKVSANSASKWFSMPGPSGDVTYSFRMGKSISTAIGYTVMQPHVFIRAAFSGKDVNSQRKLSYLGPVLQVVVWTSVMLIALLAFGLMPGLSGAETEMVIPILAEKVIAVANPTLALVIMVGFFLGVLGVGISTADSFLLVAASIVYRDFVQPFTKDKSDPAKEKRQIQIVMTVIGFISIIFALNPPELMHTLTLFAVSIVVPLFPVLVIGMFWRRATKEAAIVSAVVGAVLVAMTYLVWGMGNIWYGLVGLIAATILMPIVSLLTPDRSSDADEMIETYNTNFEKIYELENKVTQVKYSE